MKILVFGPKARYDAYMPEFARELGAELVFCPLGSSPRQAAADKAAPSKLALYYIEC